uniref:Uncharacterized protein n=1 Tax=Arundo donax TaxID=35708 RepID=A0A0A8ZU20_ARUDO
MASAGLEQPVLRVHHGQWRCGVADQRARHGETAVGAGTPSAVGDNISGRGVPAPVGDDGVDGDAGRSRSTAL